jgi:NAD(P)-dependent dehydrogenase (short-subunit alcohol dehydrogenase family)
MIFMAEAVFLTGFSTPLGTILSRQFLAAGNSVIAAVANREEQIAPGESADDRLTLIPWNRTSPISSHNVMLEAFRRFERIDRTLIIFDTTKDNRALHELSLAEIGRYVDGRFKGIAFLLKEIILHYQRRKERGEISLILHSEGAKVLPPLDGMGTGGFRSLGNSLFTFYQNEEITVNGFESSSSDSESYATFIVKTLGEKKGKTHGKWFKFQDRGSWNPLENLGLSK